MSRPAGHGTPARLVCLVALYVAAVPLTYACGDDTTHPGAGGDDTSSSGGADSAFHDVAADTHHAGDGPGGDGAQTDDSGDDGSGDDVFDELPVFEAGPLPDEVVGSEKIIPLDGPQMVGDGGD